VPLRCEVPLLALAHGYPVMNLEDMTSYANCRKTIERAVRKTQLYRPPVDLGFPRSYLWPDLFPLWQAYIWLSALIEEELTKYPKSKVWIPKVDYARLSRKAEEFPVNFWETLSLLRYLVLHDCIQGLSVSYFPETSNLVNAPQLNLQLTRHTLLESIGYFPLRYLQKMKYNQKSGSTPQAFENSVVVACQGPKIKRLTKRFDQSRIPFLFIDPDTLCKIKQSSKSQFQKCLKLSTAPQASLRAIETYAAAYNIKLNTLMRGLQSGSWESAEILVTDREYDGIGRVLINFFCERKKKVFLTPEGATQLLKPPDTNTPFFRMNVSGSQSLMLTRCVVSEDERARESFENPKQDVLVSGYLGQSSRGLWDVIGTQLLKLWILVVSFTRQNNLTVFIVPEIGTDWGSPVNHLEVRSFRLLMDTLTHKGVLPLVKIRHGEFIPPIKKLWPKSLVFHKIPWTWIANACHVVVHTDSSVGIEALVDLRRPVAVWNPFDRAYSSEVWASLSEKGVRKISNERSLHDDLVRLKTEIPCSKAFSHFYADPIRGAQVLVNAVAKHSRENNAEASVKGSLTNLESE